MKFSIKDFFSKCDLMENFIFCAVSVQMWENTDQKNSAYGRFSASFIIKIDSRIGQWHQLSLDQLQ